MRCRSFVPRLPLPHEQVRNNVTNKTSNLVPIVPQELQMTKKKLRSRISPICRRMRAMRCQSSSSFPQHHPAGDANKISNHITITSRGSTSCCRWWRRSWRRRLLAISTRLANESNALQRSPLPLAAPLQSSPQEQERSNRANRTKNKHIPIMNYSSTSSCRGRRRSRRRGWLIKTMVRSANESDVLSKFRILLHVLKGQEKLRQREWERMNKSKRKRRKKARWWQEYIQKRKERGTQNPAPSFWNDVSLTSTCFGCILVLLTHHHHHHHHPFLLPSLIHSSFKQEYLEESLRNHCHLSLLFFFADCCLLLPLKTRLILHSFFDHHRCHPFSQTGSLWSCESATCRAMTKIGITLSNKNDIRHNCTLMISREGERHE